MNSVKNMLSPNRKHILVLLATILTFGIADAKVTVKKPTASTPAYMSTSTTKTAVSSSLSGAKRRTAVNSTTQSANSSAAAGGYNRKYAIYGNGCNIVISDAATDAEPYLTKIWVDEDFDGIEDADETLIADLRDVSIYGGKEGDEIYAPSVGYSITMTGGQVDEIWGGGYAGMTSTTVEYAYVGVNVDITISGGKVGYVDGGGEVYEISDENVEMNPRADVNGYVDILLYNCEYTGSRYINDNGRWNLMDCPCLSVRDFSTHTAALPEWGKTTDDEGNAIFDNYIIQTGKSTLSISWTNSAASDTVVAGVIPAEVELSPDTLVVASGSYIQNNGTIRMNSCVSYSNYQTSYANWTGNSITWTHTYTSNSVKIATMAYHSLSCSICKIGVLIPHTFKYVHADSTEVGSVKMHKKTCTLCGYTGLSNCQYTWHSLYGTHELCCKYCKYVLETGVCRGTSYSKTYYDSINTAIHSAECWRCGGVFQEEHIWGQPTTGKFVCTRCEATGHEHNWVDGVCTDGCGMKHNCTESDFETINGIEICKVCRKGCTHSYTFSDGSVYKLAKFDDKYSAVRPYHYDSCWTCGQRVKWEGNLAKHQMTFDAKTGKTHCVLTDCSFECSHENIKATETKGTQVVYAGDYAKEYTVNHTQLQCYKCGMKLACEVIDAEGNSTYQADLYEAMEFVTYNKMNGATIRLHEDVNVTSSIVLYLENLEITLDMNDCDIYLNTGADNLTAPVLYVSDGTLHIVNTVDTYRYAYIYANNWSRSIATDNAYVTLDRVHLKFLILDFDCTIGDVWTDDVWVYSTDKADITMNGKMVIFNNISMITCTFENLPAGCVLYEMGTDGCWDGEFSESWTLLYNHNDVPDMSRYTYGEATTEVWAAGPMAFSHNIVALRPCQNHYLSTATSNGISGHSGNCLYCGAAIENAAHQMTAGGHRIDEDYHYRACAICGYEAGKTLHIFNGETLKCSDELCQSDAAVALFRQGKSEREYFGSFASAWAKTNRPGLMDTIILLQDVALAEPLAVATDTTDNTVPYMFVKGDSLTLSYTGQGKAVSFPTVEGQSDNEMIFCKGLRCTSNWNVATDYMCTFNDSHTEVIACTHPAEAQKYAYYIETVTSSNGSDSLVYLSNHQRKCSICYYEVDENHDYGGTANCIHCGVGRVTVATAMVGNDTIGQYATLNEAFESAIAYSADSAVTVSVYVDRNLEVFEDENSANYSIICIDNANADVRLYAADASGMPYDVTGSTYNRDLFYINQGKLTICSGNYSASGKVVNCRYTGTVQLEGGTYTYAGPSSHTDKDAIYIGYRYFYNSKIQKNVVYSNGLASAIVPGYYLVTSRANTAYGALGLNTPQLSAWEVVGCDQDTLTISASGEIYACSHSNLENCDWVEATDVTCTKEGNIRYRQCDYCGAYFYNDEEGNQQITNRKGAYISALGHNYNGGDTCVNVLKNAAGEDSICGYLKRAVTLDIWYGWGTKYNGVGFESFITAWNHVNDVASWGGGIVILTLEQDMDLTDETSSMISIAYNNYNDSIVIDLNGHNLNLGSQTLTAEYPSSNASSAGTHKLIIKDSQKAGGHFIGNIENSQRMLIFRDVSVVIPDECNSEYVTKLQGASSLTLNADAYCPFRELYLSGSSSISVGDDCSFSAASINMEVGSSFSATNLDEMEFDWNAYDQSGQTDFNPDGYFYDALHNITVTDADGNKLVGPTVITNSLTSKLEWNYDAYEDVTYYTETIKLAFPDATKATDYTWTITVPDETVNHTYGYTDKGTYHLNTCSYCSKGVSAEHEYIGLNCQDCGHTCTASVRVDGSETGYTYVSDAFDAANGKEATMTLRSDCSCESSVTLADSTVLTLKLNDHTLSFETSTCAIELDSAQLYIQDGDNRKGQITNTGAYVLYVNENEWNKLFITNGSFSAASAALLVDESGNEAGPQVTILNGTFSKITTSASTVDVMSFLGENCYYYNIDTDALTLQSQTDEAGYSYISNVYAEKSGMKLTYSDSDLSIEGAAAESGSNDSVWVDKAISNNSVKAFASTGLTAVTDLTDRSVIDQLQNASVKAGYSEIIKASSDLGAYIEAKLTAATVEDVSVSASDEKVYALTCMSFEVLPYATVRIGDNLIATCINTDLVQGNFTFRLPVDADYEVGVLNVFQVTQSGDTVNCGEYRVKADSELSNKYIEIESASFGTFFYRIITEFTLADAEVYDVINTSKITDGIHYKRSFSTLNTWEPLYVPMPLKPANGCDIASIYTFGIMADTNNDGKVSEEDEMVLIVDKLDDDDATEANVPYLIRSTEVTGTTLTFTAEGIVLEKAETFEGSCSTARTRYTFCGIYDGQQLTGNYQYSVKEGMIGASESGESISPQRWYIQASNKKGGYNAELAQAEAAGIRIFTIGEDLDEATALRLLKGDKIEVWQGGKCYTLDGRLANKVERGIQVTNGKKTVNR